MSGAVLNINLANLTHNYEFLRTKIATNVKLLAVVKAVAYGSDSVAIAKHLQHLGADYLGVAYAEEGVVLRQNGITIPILVLHAQPQNYELIVEHNLEPSLYSLRTLNLFFGYVKKVAIKNYPVHIKYNSGLNRLGFSDADISTIITHTEESQLHIQSIFSHLAASEAISEKEFTFQQIQRFKTFSEALKNQLNYTPIIHQSNTSGILNYPEAHFSMVRTGIGLYGFGNDPKYDTKLKPIASLTAKISQIHKIPKGASVGYNRGFIAKENVKTATITLGHADGIGRIYGKGKGYVVINGQRALILGNVCMDMLMVNITDINCNEGDRVILFDENYSADTLAASAATISYELITGIGSRVRRIITDK